jgi:hypothetical protein
MINLNLDTYTLSSSLPSSFYINQVDASVTVHIIINNITIYSTRLYPNGTIATFYEFRSIVREYMRSHFLSIATVKVSADYGGGGETTNPKYIIFSDTKFSNDYDADFLVSNFLINRTYLTLPRNYGFALPFFHNGTDAVDPMACCKFETSNGKTFEYWVGLTAYTSNYPRVVMLSCGPEYVKRMADNEEGEDLGRLLSYTVYLGKRSMTFYVTDELPTMEFEFLSAFNVWHTMYIYGTTNLKTDIDRKEAVISGSSTFYDQTVERLHEVQTAPMTIEEANWFNEFLESPYVWYNINEDVTDIRVLISDIKSEISDSSKDLIRMKFSWRHDDNTHYRDIDRIPQVFNKSYAPPFK